MPAPLSPGPGSEIAGHRLLRLLGSGSQSRVFLAHDQARGRTVALKVAVLPPGAAAAATAAAALHASAAAAAALPPHPGIAAVWGHGTAPPWTWVAMEPVPGVGLERHTRPRRLLPEPAALRLAARIAAALAHAHRHGVVHRDLKPANVLLHWGLDSVRIVDFGLARGDAGPSHSGTGLLLGTPAYMAPEQLAGAVPDARSDLYALGAMTFELLAGTRPHEADSMGELLRRVASQPPRSLGALRPDLPPAVAPALDALLQRLLARRPADRAADAGEVARALDALALQWPAPPGAAGTGFAASAATARAVAAVPAASTVSGKPAVPAVPAAAPQTTGSVAKSRPADSGAAPAPGVDGAP